MWTKDELADAIRSLPDDTPLREAIEQLQFIVSLDERIAYADAHPGEGVPQAEVRRRFEAGEPPNQSRRRIWKLTKDQLAEKIRALPDDATIDDAIERLEVIRLIQRGIAAANAGRVMTQDEVERRVAQWRE
jgi:predicted transcriptional regulator